MAISSTVRKAGPFTGAGTVSTFPFPFVVFQPSDVLVVTLNKALGIESTLVLNNDYSVSLNANQNANPGGSITLSNGALPAGYSLVISSDIPQLQGTELTNQGGFYPEVLTDSLDLATILIQQQQEQLSRTISFPISDPSGISTQIPPVAQRAGMYLTFDANGAPQAVISAPTQADPQTLSFGYMESESSADQTVFATPPYTPGGNNLFVTSGGLTLAVGEDYIETSPGSITLTESTPAGIVFTFRSIVASGFTPGGAAANVQVVPYAASVTLNAGLANGFYISGMTGDLTIAGVWGLTAGQPIAMYYQQDAVGGRTVTFAAIMVGAAQPDPTPNAVSVQLFGYDAVTGELRAAGPLVSANGAFFAQGVSSLGSITAASASLSGPIAAASANIAGLLTAASANIGDLLTAAAANVAALLTAGQLTLTAPGTAGQVLTNVGGIFVPQSPAPVTSTITDITSETTLSTVYTNASPRDITIRAIFSYPGGPFSGGTSGNVNGAVFDEITITDPVGSGLGSSSLLLIVPAGKTWELIAGTGISLAKVLQIYK